ncbi:mediator of RNA polymerase II transcription subunit 9 [Drosophila grimshawi]|uniref:Mediator of RNA polymerase II transcription subunit 9 n=1 Tax=Drosophila grimshawi TaxID=7222 RepID=B4J6U8_DROGR|nr:mediator of RNA polymerase II transcription subunit 9 [Drosophila grimshawi]EDW02029.1 GH20126 [Drosophila grimshawi]
MELSPHNQIEDRKPILTADGLVQTSNSPFEPTAAAATTATNTQTATTTVSQETQTSNGIGIGIGGPLTVDQLDIEILPIIYDIVRCVEKDPLENTVKLRESQDCNHKIFELQKRFESAREQIKQLPGIDYNKEEQLQRLELLRSQLKLKQQLIRKYKDTEF